MLSHFWGNWGRALAANLSDIWWEIQLKIETNPCSPTFEAVQESLSNFEGVFRHFVMNLSDFFWLQTSDNVHGTADESFPPSLVHSKWPNFTSTFFAPALRGSRHSSHNQKQIHKEIWLWDELACLVLRLSALENSGGTSSGASSLTQLGIDLHGVGMFRTTLLCLADCWPGPRHPFMWQYSREQRNCGNLLSRVWEGKGLWVTDTKENISWSGGGKRIRSARSSSRTATRLWSIKSDLRFLIWLF